MSINELPMIMIRCLLLTIIIEIIVGLILGIRNKKDIINIILVNIVTNPIVVSIPILVLVKYGYSAKNCKNAEDYMYKTRSEAFGDEVKRRIMVGSFMLSGSNVKEYYTKALMIRNKMKE